MKGVEQSVASGNMGIENLKNPYFPNFKGIPAKMTDPAPRFSNPLLLGWWRTMLLALWEMPARRARLASRLKELLTS
ncbi:hypothetical protein AgCh_026039 [Apium graveolens]